MGRPCMKSSLYIWCTYYGETLYEEFSVYMDVHTMGRPCMKSPLYIWCTYYGETLYEEFSVYMVYILWGDLV